MDYLNSDLLQFILAKADDIEFIVFLFVSIAAWIIKTNFIESIEKSKDIFINTYKDEINILNQINSLLILLSLEPENSKKSKKVFEILVKNIHILKYNNKYDFLNNIYKNYTNKEKINERLFIEFLRSIRQSIKEKNNIIEKHKKIYVDYNKHYLKFYLYKFVKSVFMIVLILVILYAIKYIFQFLI